MKKITLILILIATFATKSFAYCPIPQWCPKADLHQTLWTGETIDAIEFPTVMGKTLVVEWWTDGTRSAPTGTPTGITVSGGATSTNNRDYLFPVSISGSPTAVGTHHYTVSNLCGVLLLSGSITVNATPTGCNFGTPARNLVTITSARFATNQTWPVGNQIWSDAVVSDQCAPRGNSYYGGSDPNFNVDCRNAINGFDGSYFSWCALMKHADIFCPGDWRLPTTEDFVELYQEFGFTYFPGDYNEATHGNNNTYMTDNIAGTGTSAINRGGTWGGSRFTADATYLEASNSRYWSSSEVDTRNAHMMNYSNNEVWPHLNRTKDWGYALRCVR